MNKYLKLAIGGFIGGLAGYIYYHFWGCTNGCPLQSNWMVMTGYGLFAGLVIMLPVKKKKQEDKNNE
jgi:hypothetical protein